MSIEWRKYLKISRPKFWLYLVGPYFLGGVLGVSDIAQLAYWPFWALFAWFTLPANLLLYGVNDASDYDTDRFNPKKARQEALVYPHERPELLLVIAVLATLAIPPLLAVRADSLLPFAGFMVLSIAYSAPPFRMKGRPGLDSLSNMLYMAPLLVSWSFFSPEPPAAPLVLAGICWCMAMHAYSAIPDIASDKRAGLRTTATVLGRDGTLQACALLYGAAALLVFAYDPIAGAFLAVYPALMLAQRFRAPSRVAHWYGYFPALNGLVGMILTFRFLLPLAR